MPDKFCDVVMKGGITSGVVYPRAIHELSQAFTFKNVGGTSAGAIAACVTAAAEYQRLKTGSDAGFERVRKIPDEIAGDKLFSLFEPEPETTRVFEIATAALGDEPWGEKATRVFWTAVGAYPHIFALAILPAIVTAWLARPIAAGVVTAIVVLGLGALAFAIAIAGWIVGRVLPRNAFGICGGAALIDWLDEQVNLAAGRTKEDPPLTFRDLWGDGDSRAINLEMVTTNLTHGRPYHFPRENDNIPRFYFKAEELRRVFPKRIVDHLVAGRDESQELSLPDSKDLPIVFAARLSLSFPVLFRLVPLHALDYTWVKTEKEPRMTVCWFIDGGLTSNFPIHLFDSMLPQWPTFGLDLREFHPAYPPSDKEDENFWMVKKNSEGFGENWNVFAETVTNVSVNGYLGAILNTMQNWRDNTQQRLPGYRDRIAHVKLRPIEGGLNLKMPKDRVEKLAERGRGAAAELRNRFTKNDHELDWNNHRFVRYLTAMSHLENALGQIDRAMAGSGNGGATYEQILSRVNPENPTTGYKDKVVELRAIGTSRIQHLRGVLNEWRKSKPRYPDLAPKPTSDLQITPRF
ncbi:MAG TPA: patatin-like phospholipase family protein [Thermoanaerobaculia bacterium]|nr:patatin-like phospholipase family protein [Thermoanaerobaculia bacterium]